MQIFTNFRRSLGDDIIRRFPEKRVENVKKNQNALIRLLRYFVSGPIPLCGLCVLCGEIPFFPQNKKAMGGFPWLSG
jgi:hypothetical protein